MGLYARPDSPFWWYLLEGTNIRRRTDIPRQGGSPAQDKELRRQAHSAYILAKAEHALGKAARGKPTIGFSSFARWYETHVISTQRGHDKGRSMLRQLERYFSRFDDLAAITVPVVKEWMTWRKASVGPSTVNRELAVLKPMIKAAVPTYLDHSPLAGLGRLRAPETEPRVLTHEEEERLLAVCGPQERAFILTALDTLLRLGSVLYLKWPQVKLDRRVILPLNAKVSTGAKPISSRLLAALTDLKPSDGYVFAQFHLKGHGPSAAKNQAIRRFDYLCRAANIPRGRAVEGLTFHCLRHTGATRALQAGASIRTVMNLGGWKDERMVLRYCHATDSDVQHAAELIGQSRQSRDGSVSGAGQSSAPSRPYGDGESPRTDSSIDSSNPKIH